MDCSWRLILVAALTEFKKSRQALGDTSTEHFNVQWGRSRSIVSEVFDSLAWDCAVVRTLPLTEMFDIRSHRLLSLFSP